jgi:hypothetical protein
VPIAAFESEPEASAAGTVLRELGFDADVIVRGVNTFEERTHDFFAGKPVPFEPHAVKVQRHYGVVLEPE